MPTEKTKKKDDKSKFNFQVTLTNVRLSFAHIWRAQEFDQGESKFNANFLIDKEKQEKLILQIKDAMRKAKAAKWGDNPPKMKLDQYCLQDGEPVDEDSGEREPLYDGYEGMMFLKASNKKRPTIVDRDNTPLSEDDGYPYAGCYVDAIVNIYGFASKNPKIKKRINASLEGIRFRKDGEAFGAKPLDADAFGDPIDDDDFEDDDEPKKSKSKKSSSRSRDDDDDDDLI